MKKNAMTGIWAAMGILLVFFLWTMIIQFADVQAIGPRGTSVGLATMNGAFHRLTGEHMVLYAITDWLGLVPIVICACFGLLGLTQLIRRRSFLKVDTDILLLGAYYIFVILAYLVFEMIPINYRPLLIDGMLEASYPSSTILLVLSVMPTLVFQVNRRAKSERVRRLTAILSALFTAFMVIGRLISGVHWLTDVIGAVLMSAGLYLFYHAGVMLVDQKKQRH